jgi:arylsulfatase A-like enzyme
VRVELPRLARTLGSTLVGALALQLAGCSERAFVQSGVVHLDPRLEDGSSAAEKLASAATEWFDRTEIEGPGDTGDWTPRYCEVAPSGVGAGISVRANVLNEGRFRRVEFLYDKSFDSSAVDLLEIDLEHTSRGLARVSWRNSFSDPSSDNWVRYANAIVEDTQERRTVRISLADHPEWRGEISELTLVPKQDGQQRFNLSGLRLGRVGFSPGDDALPREQGLDGGLIGLGREARRAWPSDWDVPLFAKVRVASDGRFCADVAVSGITRNLAEEVHFALDLAAESDEWIEVAHKGFVPGTRVEGTACWETLIADLSHWAGKEVRLRMRAFHGAQVPGAAQGLGGKLERASVYWGAPLVLGRQPKDRRPNVLLVTLDTTRADAFGCLGARVGPQNKSPTPYFDRLASASYLFENAWTACNATSPSHASLLTGLAVQDHGVLDNRGRLGPESVTIAECFRAAGYMTAAAVSVEHLEPGKSGLGQGFDEFVLAGGETASDGAMTIRSVKERLAAWSLAGDRPFFLWVHIFDPHTPYGVPDSFLRSYCKSYGVSVPDTLADPPTQPASQWSKKGRFLENVTNCEFPRFVYQTCVAYADRLIENLASDLSQLHWLDHTAIAVIADHGEALGEHDNWYNHTGLYNEVMHVPLIVHTPQQKVGKRVAALAWSLDLPRTLLEIGGIGAPAEYRGTSLVQLAERGSQEPRRLWLEHSDLHQVGACDDEYTTIYSVVDYDQWGRERRVPKDTLELYDRAADPGQTKNLASERPDAAKRYVDGMRDWQKSALDRKSQASPISPEDEARLKQLGY